LTYSIPEIEGFIGYKIESSVAVVLGDPVCSPDDKHILAKAFDEECRKKSIKAIYTMTSNDFKNWAINHLSAIAIEFGNVLILNPELNPVQNKGSKAVLLRKKVKHALKEGVEVSEYTGNDAHIESRIIEIANNWVKKRHGFQIHLGQISIFKDRNGKRWFYARQAGNIVGFLVINELQAKNGWLLNNVMIVQDAAHGLSELLIISTLETLQKEGCRYISIGPIPSKQLKINGLGEIKAAFLQILFKGAGLIFRLGGHATFWEKFQGSPEGSYLVFPHGNLGFTTVRALLKAFNVSKG
jgi:lysylphosphatidylglycerol synthetase-like protein (DUF2156 family)